MQIAGGEKQEGPTSIFVQTGDITILETVSLSGIKEHIMALLQDSGNRGHVQGMLEARMLAGEATEVLGLVQKAVKQEGSPGGHRFKRNILGDIISSLTGLAQQETYDKELRRKMEDLIRTQQAEANTIEQMVMGITEEEESLDGRLNQQQQIHKQDIAFLQQHSTSKFFVTQDLQTLKHILTSLHTGHATPLQSIMFTAKIKAGIANNFQYVNITILHDTLTSTYKAALYTPAQLHSVQSLLQAWQVRTDKDTYLMSQKPTHTTYITIGEARILGGTCTNCTLLVHMGQGWYKTLREGWLVCSSLDHNTLAAGSLIYIENGGHCGNDIMQIQQEFVKHNSLKIDIGSVDTVDQHILQKYVANGSSIESVRQTHQRHKYD
jgi:hypothetical protein